MAGEGSEQAAANLEKAQTAVERAREGLRTAQFVVIGAAIVLALIAVVSRRAR